MAFTYEDVIPPLIENTTMQKRLRDGVDYQYLITPNEGFVLHDARMDEPVYDMETGEETGEVVKIYRTSTATCAANYDFTENPWEFYTVPADSVPADDIHGVGGNTDHETM